MSQFTIPKAVPGFQTLCKLFMRVSSHYTIQGRENIVDPPFIVIMNHTQHTDIPAIVASVPHEMVAMGAKKMRKRPIGQLFKLGAIIWVEQDSADRQALKQAIQVIKAGASLAISPEGHRSLSPGMKMAKPGAAYIANRTNAPIIPIGLVGTHRVLRHPRPKVTVTIGKPFQLPSGRASTEELEEYTEYMMCAIASLLPESYHGVYAKHLLINQIREHGTNFIHTDRYASTHSSTIIEDNT